MKKLFAALAIAMATVLTTGCFKVIDTGEVGLRKNYDKTIEATEIPEGKFAQTVFGEVLTFPVRDVNVFIDNLPAVIAADNATMKEVDFNLIYNINPSCVSDLYVKKSRSFHAIQDGDILLMNTYIRQIAGNAISKSVRGFEAMKANDNKPLIEQNTITIMADKLKEDKLDGCINITSAQARALTPPDSLRISADELVKEKTDKERKVVQVQTAELEAQRIKALSANKDAIEYMNAQSLQMIAQGVRDGKAKAIVIPVDFKGIVNTQ